MVEVVQKIRKVGGSLMIRIPKYIADYEGLEEGQSIYAELRKEPKNLLGSCPGIGPWEKEDPSVHSKYA